ncbi:Tat (twin-arginine translocation) pathway signal sequence [Cnuella takakiae]|uniref:Tat (Twin-arginine translocation) pathway signal sequence n=1 Tax=Cnuella takakiae TaxID=1302690 RepID=A0A1M4ZXF8_9BACT|nr:Dabb family protein [Cnuella takakiae]OLY92178.1 stress protein [Cnuella takakiae]SHF22402.1 Tat (twin-arginine translocation) pathway signal sequence [Cnuella takakiae]
MQQNRRKFLSNAALTVAAAGAASLPVQAAQTPAKAGFIHHVYFWLKNPESKEDKAKLLEGLRTLSKVKTIQNFYIGQPADTNRDVIDRSYAVSWLLFFANKADQDSYQVDPVHLDFVKNYSHLWQRVVVYDSVDV